ncbi:MAG: serine/threonine-protein phosphatase [Anaerolineales bacterium]|nr:serine/threonine-protein phosphatase [Anaerolineales bacterium]
MIPTSKPHIQVATISHPGEVRDHNEDRFLTYSFLLQDQATPGVLAVVADGVGGHKAGEVAAQIAADTIQTSIAAAQQGTPVENLREAILEAGREVASLSQQEAKYAGMGTTVAVALVIKNSLYTATIGDSRIYFLRNRTLRQISIDHTWIHEALKHKLITPEEAKNHPNAHVIQKAIGNPTPPEPDFRLNLSDSEIDEQSIANQGLLLKGDDQILLCSDGLTDLVERKEIENALLEQTPDDAVQALASLARARGGHDNITIVILKIPPGEQKKPSLFLPILTALTGSFFLVVLVAVLSLIVWRLGFWPW